MTRQKFRYGESWNERLWFFRQRLLESVAEPSRHATNSVPAVHCPKCRSVMNTVALSGVEIEICSRCDGVYLDRGELELLRRKAG